MTSRIVAILAVLVLGTAVGCNDADPGDATSPVPAAMQTPTGTDSPAVAVPEPLLDLVGGRDDTPLPDGALVRLQVIGLTPAIGDNFRLVLDADGALRVARNSPGPPSEPDQRFNVELPGAPDTTVPTGTVARVEELLQRELGPGPVTYRGNEGVRDGHVAIVTARTGDGVHELWYRNSDSELVTLLWALADEVS